MDDLNHSTSNTAAQVQKSITFSTDAVTDPVVRLFHAWDMLYRAVDDMESPGDERMNRVMATVGQVEAEITRTEATSPEGVAAKLRLAMEIVDTEQAFADLMASAIRDLERMGEESFATRFGGVVHPAAA